MGLRGNRDEKRENSVSVRHGGEIPYQVVERGRAREWIRVLLLGQHYNQRSQRAPTRIALLEKTRDRREGQDEDQGRIL